MLRKSNITVSTDIVLQPEGCLPNHLKVLYLELMALDFHNRSMEDVQRVLTSLHSWEPDTVRQYMSRLCAGYRLLEYREGRYWFAPDLHAYRSHVGTEALDDICGCDQDA